MNKINLIGRITKDPELKVTLSGVSVCSFNLAVDRSFKDANGQKQTDFIPCVAWRQQADFIGNYVKKGYLLAVSGEIQSRTYQTQQGEMRVLIEVVLDNVENLTPKEPQTKPNPNSSVKVNGEGVDFTPDDDLPF